MNNIEFRREFAPDPLVLICRCRVVVQVQQGWREAVYSYHYYMEKTDGTSLDEWLHVVPVPSDEVSDVTAEDGDGGLQTTISSRNHKATDIRIAFRSETQTPSRQEFSFHYKAPISCLPLSRIWSATIVYFDSFYHNNRCKDLSLEITPPAGAELVKSNPPLDQGSSPLRYHLGEMQAFDGLTFQLAFKVHRIGKQFWIWLGTVLTSALLGVIGRKLLG